MSPDRYMPDFEHNGRRYQVLWDHDYQTRGSYSYDTDEETKAAEDEEIRMLESGQWVVVGIIMFERHEKKCKECCGEWIEVDSVWGCVIENDDEKVRKFVIENYGS